MDLYAKVHTHVYAYNACMHTCNKSLVECLDQSNSAYVPPPVGVLHHARLFTAGSGWRRGRGFICRGSPFVGLPLSFLRASSPISASSSSGAGVFLRLGGLLVRAFGLWASSLPALKLRRALGVLALRADSARARRLVRRDRRDRREPTLRTLRPLINQAGSCASWE